MGLWQKKIGCQTPSRSFVLPYEMTDGARAVEIYNSTGFKAQEWQELLLYDILAFNDDGLCFTILQFPPLVKACSKMGKSKSLILTTIWQNLGDASEKEKK